MSRLNGRDVHVNGMAILFRFSEEENGHVKRPLSRDILLSVKDRKEPSRAKPRDRSALIKIYFRQQQQHIQTQLQTTLFSTVATAQKKCSLQNLKQNEGTEPWTTELYQTIGLADANNDEDKICRYDQKQQCIHNSREESQESLIGEPEPSRAKPRGE
uniref:Uncharacterized protein n=1 Tax=Meloidogyne incognita TaxID=6306 RepID=A0A914L5U0_MELIC